MRGLLGNEKLVNITASGALAEATAAFNAIREGRCAAYAEPLFQAEEWMISSANAPCDMRILRADPIAPGVLGGFSTIAPYAREREVRRLHGPNATTGGASCTGLLTDALGAILRGIVNTHFSGYRAQQLARQRNSTCLPTGAASAATVTAASISALSRSLRISDFWGLWLLMGITLIAALATAPTTQTIVAQYARRSGWIQKRFNVPGGDWSGGARRLRPSAASILRELTQIAPAHSVELESHLDERLDHLEMILEVTTVRVEPTDAAT